MMKIFLANTGNLFLVDCIWKHTGKEKKTIIQDDIVLKHAMDCNKAVKIMIFNARDSANSSWHEEQHASGIKTKRL